ncbi:hypothetical protein ACFXDJ_13930 [Streptomyces sp. NPDC059443]|uniref:hypothetical protein n=1 Tax=unclassified Streptomyces TaxID=2593676 RepID=UPI0036CE24B8
MGQKTVLDTEPERETEKKKLDLSATQVAGSSLATVAAALLASKMGVYGTILGAGVVSVVATAGGPVIQHFFRRTGDQLRESARPKARQVPVEEAREERAPDGTMMLRATPLPPPPGLSEEFGEGTVHGSRVRGWKRTAVASAAAFAISIGGIAAYEAFSGTAVSSDSKTVWGGTAQNAGTGKPDTGNTGNEPGRGGKDRDKGGTTPGTGNSPSPSPSKGNPSPAPDPSPSPDPTPSPTPPKPDPKPTPTPAPTPPPSTGQATPGGGGAGTGTGQESRTP